MEQGDATAPDFPSKVAERVADRLDVLVNSAGMTSKEDQHDKIAEADVDMWDKMINLNLLVPMKLTHALAPILARSHAGGHIINISSVAGLRPSKYNAAYSASKWGLTGWSKACFEELKEQNIRVTTIFPAYVSSDMTRGVPIDNAKMILPEDIAQAALLPFQMSANACPTEIVINNTEPLKKPQS
ncbi:NAD(P)-binding protein [Coccomyxa subellipsoidea C-169]|uniref:3-oxoacyl-[acyl-carrier-protein] reductase n=1 Tax=Coccomyxa subellipsoidea (strain C-169) TaxID=574566 RepID=I0YTX7_COCSC|nr:NAD(P)-binding protein [Coccomyxa subellipsoidea C-169]EIE21846.1 NAD(P)-binding protein [Coccomyxa subellipsoidea C-169]|eukprot:XP_005646390.1 NAD(P)-binding protein [Coccomyxa subellipsoidea C-169]